VLVTNEAHRQEHGDDRTVFPDIPLLHLIRIDLPREQLLGVGEILLEVVRVSQVLKGLLKELCLGEADELAKGLVHLQPSAVEADEGHSDRGIPERRLELVVQLAEPAHCLVALGDVLVDRHHAVDRPGVRERHDLNDEVALAVQALVGEHLPFAGERHGVRLLRRGPIVEDLVDRLADDLCALPAEQIGAAVDVEVAEIRVEDADQGARYVVEEDLVLLLEPT
jgi:hypothetical protein